MKLVSIKHPEYLGYSEGCKCFSWLDGGNVGTHWWVLRGKP